MADWLCEASQGHHAILKLCISFFLLSSPVLVQLHEADLIAVEERERVSGVGDVVRVQRGKSPDKMTVTAEILKQQGFEEMSVFLRGTSLHSDSPYVCTLDSLMQTLTSCCVGLIIDKGQGLCSSNTLGTIHPSPFINIGWHLPAPKI